MCSASRQLPAAPTAVPVAALAKRGGQPPASLSPRTFTHRLCTSLLLPLGHPPTSYLCSLRWPTHRPRPPPHPPTHPGRIAALFMCVHASHDGLRVRAEAAIDNDAGGDGG